MAAVMAEMMGMPEEMLADMAPPMYVATNQDKVQGAAVMFYPEFHRIFEEYHENRREEATGATEKE